MVVWGVVTPTFLLARVISPDPTNLIVQPQSDAVTGQRCGTRRSRHSSRTERTKRSAYGLQFGLRGGICTTLTPSLAKTASNAAVNFVSRFRTRCVNLSA